MTNIKNAIFFDAPGLMNLEIKTEGGHDTK